MTSFKSIAGLAAMALLITPVAMAGSADVKTKPVSLAGLDLNTQAGAELALDRIETAAEQVCGYNEARWSLAWKSNATVCMKTAIANAVEARGHRGLTAHYKATHKYG